MIVLNFPVIENNDFNRLATPDKERFIHFPDGRNRLSDVSTYTIKGVSGEKYGLLEGDVLIAIKDFSLADLKDGNLFIIKDKSGDTAIAFLINDKSDNAAFYYASGKKAGDFSEVSIIGLACAVQRSLAEINSKALSFFKQ